MFSQKDKSWIFYSGTISDHVENFSLKDFFFV